MTTQQNNMIDCNGLTKSYGKMPVLFNLDLHLPAGKIIGLLGPNGSGKTTFIKLAAGLLKPTSGTIRIHNQEIGPETKAIVSYLPERPYFDKMMTPMDMMDFFVDFYSDFDRNRAETMIKNLQIDPTSKMKHLSKGNKEKVQLILVMSRRAKLYLLDEPIAGVDPAARDYILRTIISNYDPSATVIISTHLLYDVENTLDEYIFLSNGKILLYDSVKSAKEKHGVGLDELFRRVYGW